MLKKLLAPVAGIAALVAAAVAIASPTLTATARLVRVTSPASPGSDATLVARVSPARRCSITVYYKSGPSVAQGLYPKRPRNGRVSWTWMVGTNREMADPSQLRQRRFVPDVVPGCPLTASAVV